MPVIDGIGEWEMIINKSTGSVRIALGDDGVYVERDLGIVIPFPFTIVKKNPEEVAQILASSNTCYDHLVGIDTMWCLVNARVNDEEAFQALAKRPGLVAWITNIGINSPFAAQRLKVDCEELLRRWDAWKIRREKEKLLDSPIEQAFWAEWMARNDMPTLMPQHNILDGKYRIDFAHLESNTAIELDGFIWHNTPEQFAKDRRRERELQKLGWRVIRFSGQEIHQNVAKCVDEALAMIKG